MSRRLPALFVLLVSLISPGFAAGFPWHGEFTETSDPELAALHESLHRAAESGFRAYPVSNLALSLPGFTFTMDSGTVFLEPPVDGVTVGAFFEGEGRISYRPDDPAAIGSLKARMGVSSLKEVPVSSATLFTLDPESPLHGLAAGPPAETPAAPDSGGIYASDKSALRQLGMRQVELFLNRDSVARGATMIVAPLATVRTPGSEEARILYAYDPTQHRSVDVSIFGHQEIAEKTPFKNRFTSISAFRFDASPPPFADVDLYATEISLGKTAESAVESSTITFDPAAGLKAARMEFTSSMELSEITGPSGESIPFLQWKHMRTHINFDERVLVDFGVVPAEDGDSISLTFRSEGVLFEPWLRSYVLMDEDNWYPRLDINDDAHHELTLTIPKNLVGIGVGERVSEERNGQEKTLVFRTTQPTKNSTFYFGDYVTRTGKADDVEVELFQDRRDIGELKNAKFVVTEIANAIKVYNRLFMPLDIETLRVTSTRTTHGRGFEGLLLMGGRGTEESASSAADLFRAHEVAHQWWGNMLRPESWPEDRWLSEAFAEFSAMEYYRARFENENKAREQMRIHWYDPLTEGSIFHENLSGERVETFGRTTYPICSGKNNVYSKGPMVLTMLRYMFRLSKKSDDPFFAMLRDFLETYRYQFVSSRQFQEIAEKHFGDDLDWFFRQWVEDGGVPVVKWKHQIREDQGKFVLTLSGDQIQKRYRLIIPVFIHFPKDGLVVRPWIIEGESAEKTFRLPARPTKVTLNDSVEALVVLQDG